LTEEDDRARALEGLTLLNEQSRAGRSAISQSKLRPAANPTYLVERPRLYTLLDQSTLAPLTLVVAPAGSGKTSLLRGWVAAAAVPHAWLSLDADDRDPVQLWRGLFAALEGIAPGCASAGADRLRRPGGLLPAVVAVLDDLEARSYEPKVLVVDDLHLVDDDPDVGASLALFVQHLPTWLHVVIASRREPSLPVHRLRARGELGEVRFPELRFAFDEAVAMLTRLVPDLEPHLASEVAARAGGWAASIQLAALAARSAQAQGSRFLPDQDGDRHYLEDYVWLEVLAPESDDLVDALLATSVVDRVDPGLARVLTGRTDATELLARAEERGLFVTRIELTGAFEMHGLVREVLLSVLARRWPGRLRQLHGWAAGWHEAHGQSVTALEHWLRAERPRDALRLLSAQVAALSDGGHESTVRRTIEAIPEGVASGDLEAMMEFTWCHLLVDRRRFGAMVDSLGRRSDAGALSGGPLLVARLEVLQSIAATLRGHWADGASLARSALQELDDRWWLDPIGQFAWNAIARDIAFSERWDDATSEVRQVVRALGVAPDRRLALEGTRALAEVLAGRPVDALRLAAGVRKASEVSNLTILRTEVLTAEALAHRELGELPVALPVLLELATERIEPTPYCALLAQLELTQVRVDEGDLEAARRAFGLAAESVDTELTGPDARSWLARAGSTLALASGDLKEAQGWVTQVRDPFWTGITSARVLLGMDDPGQAFEALKTAEPRCVRHRVVADLLQARATADPEEAERCLLHAVRLAAAHGLVQTVASEGIEVVEAVERLAWQAPQTWLARLRRAVVPGVATSTLPGQDLVETLTERELEVLRLLPSRLTLREISDELFISINTLKFHLRVIYRKLDCASRGEAAEVARAMTTLRRPGHPSRTRRR
jgi:LuxR family transcriptional regulator, maltose regulon positive regulatory protein